MLTTTAKIKSKTDPVILKLIDSLICKLDSADAVLDNFSNQFSVSNPLDY